MCSRVRPVCRSAAYRQNRVDTDPSDALKYPPLTPAGCLQGAPHSAPTPANLISQAPPPFREMQGIYIETVWPEMI